MPKVYRSMLPDGGKPMLGSAGKMLGIRIKTDITPDAAGNVHPATGGMSVAPQLRSLPKHLLPKRLRRLGVPNADGSDRMNVWTMGVGEFGNTTFAPGLNLRIDDRNPEHGFLEPDRVLRFDEYRAAIDATRG